MVFSDFVNNVSIKSSFKNMTDTAQITLPRKITWTTKTGQKLSLINGVKSIIQRGDKIKIELGYYTNGTAGLREVFNGYVTKLVPNAPVIIDCEDSMFVIKDILVTYPSTHTEDTNAKGKKVKPRTVADKEYNLNELLNAFLTPKGIPYINLAGPVSMGTLIWTRLSMTQVLDQLRGGSTLGICLYSYFVSGKVAKTILSDYATSTTFSDFQKGGKYIMTNTKQGELDDSTPVLCVGFVNNPFVSNTETFYFDSTYGNIIEDTNLFYQIEKDIDLQVVATSVQKNNKNFVRKQSYGAVGGNVVSKPCTINLTDEQLLAAAKDYYRNYAYTGYRGSFTTFGEPYVIPGDRAQLYSFYYPDKDGLYQIMSVNREFGMGGYRQEIEIGELLGGTQSS